MKEYDVIVIGAGIFGLASAYHIKRENPNHKVLIIEKRNAAGQENTAKSAGCFRNFFYSKTNFKLANSSIKFYEYIQEEEGFNLGIKWIGYLWLFDYEQFRSLESSLKDMMERGLKYKIVNEEEIKKSINPNTRASESGIEGLRNINVGLFIPKAGKMDVEKLVNYYELKFKDMGGKIMYGVNVNKIIVEPEEKLGLPGEPYFWQRSKATGVEANGKFIKAEKIVVAANVWADNLLHPLGIDTYQRIKKRQIFVVKSEGENLEKLLYVKGFNNEGCLPFTILPQPRIYVKPDIDEKTFWIGYADDFLRPIMIEDDPQPEENFYRYGIYPILSIYLPQFKDANPVNAWAGHYGINTFDGQPVVFMEANIIVATADSGSGIMKGDAIGRIVASIYADRKEAELFDGEIFHVEDIGVEKRRVEKERFMI
ncbi:MAG: FAD-binding oxidoreductase [Candidatus Methanomethylicia archaeon]|nr:FAD-binding oxidoreductase [Candidatus Methanomethylicia archaeon]